MATEAAVELDAAYRQLREEAGFVRRPSWRVLAVHGPDAVDYLESQLTNDVATLAPGQGRYAALLDRKGHLRADLRILLLEPERAWLIAEAEGADRLAAHLGMYRIGRDVELDPADEIAISVIGPATGRSLGTDPPPDEGSHRVLMIGGVEARAVGTTSGVDLLAPRQREAELMAALEAASVREVDERAAEILRVEAGRPRLGREMTTETLPAEAGIVEEAVSFTKGCYIGQETVARLHYKGKPNRHLRGLRLTAPARDADIVRLGEREVGRIGTAVVSPAHGPIALAILRREAGPGSEVTVADGAIAAEVVELPFGLLNEA